MAEKEFTENERLAVIRREHNLAEKPKILAQRVKNQAQNKTTSKSRQEFYYRNPKEQFEFEQATKNVTIRKPKKWAYLPLLHFPNLLFSLTVQKSIERTKNYRFSFIYRQIGVKTAEKKFFAQIDREN